MDENQTTLNVNNVDAISEVCQANIEIDMGDLYWCYKAAEMGDKFGKYIIRMFGGSSPKS